MAKLSILIVNWNSKEYLNNCLESIFKDQDHASIETIVVDSGSYDGCEEMLKESYPEVKFIQAENLGFGKSNNLGFSSVTSENLLLLNPDTVLGENSLEVLCDYLDTLPEAGVIAPRLLNTDGTLQTSCVLADPSIIGATLDSDFFRKLMPKSKIWGVWDAFESKEPIEVQAACGACLLMKSSVYKEIGGFDSLYFMYIEDVDLCIKVRDLGLKIYHIPEVQITHHGGGSSSEASSQFNAVMTRDAVYVYFKANRGKFHAMLYKVMMTLSALVRLTVLHVMAMLKRGPYEQVPIAKWKAVLFWALFSRKPI